MPYRSGWVFLVAAVALAGCASRTPPPRASAPPPSRPEPGLHDVRPLRRDPRPTTDEAVAGIIDYNRAAVVRHEALANHATASWRGDACTMTRADVIAALRGQCLRHLRRVELPQAANTFRQIYQADPASVERDARRAGVRALPAMGLVGAFWLRWIARRSTKTPAGPGGSDGRRFV